MTTVFDSSPLKTGIHPAKDGDILCAIENYDIDNNGECIVPWNREKVSYEILFDRLSHSQTEISVTYYTILENKKVQDASGLIFSLQDLLSSVTNTKKKYTNYFVISFVTPVLRDAIALDTIAPAIPPAKAKPPNTYHFEVGINFLAK